MKKYKNYHLNKECMVIALFIGRFQPFHSGHLKAIKKILCECDNIIIGIGSSQEKNTLANPFSAKERHEMIYQIMKKEGIKKYEIIEIPDINNHEGWVDHVRTIVYKNGKEFQVIYTGSELTRALFRKQDYKVEDLPRYDNISSTEIRFRIQKDMEWKNMVPEPVAKLIENIKGVERLKKLGK